MEDTKWLLAEWFGSQDMELSECCIDDHHKDFEQAYIVLHVVGPVLVFHDTRVGGHYYRNWGREIKIKSKQLFWFGILTLAATTQVSTTSVYDFSISLHLLAFNILWHTTIPFTAIWKHCGFSQQACFNLLCNLERVWLSNLFALFHAGWCGPTGSFPLLASMTAKLVWFLISQVFSNSEHYKKLGKCV